jgi:hypothetical protein
MVVEVKQQHVSHKANDKPNRRFHYSLESGRHQQRIRLPRFPCQREIMGETPPA